jgi:hypothetical protein
MPHPWPAGVPTGSRCSSAPTAIPLITNRTRGWPATCAGAAVGTFCSAPCRVNFEGTGYNVRCVAADTWDDPTGSCTREWSAATCYLNSEFEVNQHLQYTDHTVGVCLLLCSHDMLWGKPCGVTTVGDMALFGNRAVIACTAVRPASSNIDFQNFKLGPSWADLWLPKQTPTDTIR